MKGVTRHEGHEGGMRLKSTGVKGSKVAVEMETDLVRMRRTRNPDDALVPVTRMESMLSG